MLRRRSSPALTASGRRWSLAAAGLCLVPLLLQLPPMAASGIGLLGLLSAALPARAQVPAWLRMLLAFGLVGLVLVSHGFHPGRDTGCALLAAMLAIKPLELRTLRDARSLLGFGLFAPFATFLLDQGPLSLLLGLVAAMVVLMALQHHADPETADTMPGSARSDADTAVRSIRRHAVATIRMVAIGLPLALAAFWLFPRMESPLWGIPDRALARPGLSDTMSPGEWVDLMGDDSPVLRVKFISPAPEPTQMYWRGPVLLDFDGRTWSRAEWLARLPLPDTVRTGPVWEYEVEAEPTDRSDIIALELPLSAPAGERLDHDYSMRSRRPLTRVQRWQMRSSMPAAFEPQLRPTLRQMALHLPEGYNPRTLTLAQQWRQDAGQGTEADTAIMERALQWITDEFAYTLGTPLLGRHSVDEFLFDEKAGFCEHFSSAFVVLMRASGIPARVVTGYAGGYNNRFGDYWIVRRMDAHAWAEVWLEDRGWVRVDPTAAVAPERIFDTLADRPQPGFGLIANVATASDLGDWLRRGWNDLLLGYNTERQQHLLRPLGIRKLDGPQLIILFSTVAAVALAWMLWLVARGERERDPVLRAWHALGRRYARFGLAPLAHEPAATWTRRVIAARPADGPALHLLSARFVRWRYAEGQPDPGLARDLAAYSPGRSIRTETPA